jgi:hypothetical protein
VTNFEFKVEAVKELKSSLRVLEKKCKQQLTLIEEDGINRGYSINSDIFEIATRIYKISALLGYVGSFNLEFLDKEKK